MRSSLCGIRLTRIVRALRRKPRHKVGDLLVSHRLCSIGAPIRHALVRPPGDHNAAQTLIADQRKIRPIDNGTNLSCLALSTASGSFAGCSMASCTEDAEGLLPTSGIARQRGPVLRNTKPSEKIGLAPQLYHPVRQHADLLIGQHSTRTFAEGRHQLAGNSV